MPTRPHTPPSRLRYEKSHPTVSARLPKGDYDRLKGYLAMTDQSLADLIKETLDGREPAIEAAFAEGQSDALETAEYLYKVDYRCSKCGGSITLTDEQAKQAAATYMREHGWAHTKCPRTS